MVDRLVLGRFHPIARRPRVVKLSVNVNKVDLLRNSRDGARPDVLQVSRTCLAAGCHGITVHPRPDERHIRRRDVYDLAKLNRYSQSCDRSLPCP